MIKVPYMKMPECCEECDFGRCKYSNPFEDYTETSGKKGYNCQVEFYEKGKYETIREAPYDEHIVPVQCPLIDEDKNDCDNCLYADEIDGSHCYECVKGIDNKFESGADMRGAE